MQCPNCKKVMEEGCVSADGTVISWTKGPLSLKGVTLVKGLINLSLKGHRCPDCRLVMVNY
jgi:uncharacterized OB-fold protein